MKALTVLSGNFHEGGGVRGGGGYKRTLSIIIYLFFLVLCDLISIYWNDIKFVLYMCTVTYIRLIFIFTVPGKCVLVKNRLKNNYKERIGWLENKHSVYCRI